MSDTITIAQQKIAEAIREAKRDVLVKLINLAEIELGKIEVPERE